MSVLLAHEKKGGSNSTAVKAVLPQESSDSSDNEEEIDMQAVGEGNFFIVNCNIFTSLYLTLKLINYKNL